MAPKPLTRRPLDLLYYAFFVIHVLYTTTIGILPLWPTAAQNFPGLSLMYSSLRSVVNNHMANSRDVFLIVVWGLLPRELDNAHYWLFLYIEAGFMLPCFILGMIGLKSGTTTVYPLLLAYSSVALVTTFTTFHAMIIAPSKEDSTLDPALLPYSLSDAERWANIGPLIPFLAIPIIMWVDMMVRVTGLVMKGTQVELQATRGKGKKEL